MHIPFFNCDAKVQHFFWSCKSFPQKGTFWIVKMHIFKHPLIPYILSEVGVRFRWGWSEVKASNLTRSNPFLQRFFGPPSEVNPKKSRNTSNTRASSRACLRLIKCQSFLIKRYSIFIKRYSIFIKRYSIFIKRQFSPHKRLAFRPITANCRSEGFGLPVCNSRTPSPTGRTDPRDQRSLISPNNQCPILPISIFYKVGHIMSVRPLNFAPQKLKIVSDYDVRYCNQRYPIPPHGYCYSHGICWCPQNLFLYSIALGFMCHHVNPSHWGRVLLGIPLLMAIQTSVCFGNLLYDFPECLIWE